MTKKDLVESIKQNMPEGLTELEKARYVYIEIGKQKAFDPQYYYGNARTQKRIFLESHEASQNPEKFHNKRTLVCVSLTYVYLSVLRDLGIECYTMSDDDGHMYNRILLNDENGQKIRIRADLSNDLKNIQAGLEPDQFGTTEPGYDYYDTIDKQELKEIDKKIGYIEDEYRNINELQEITAGMTATEGLKTILQDPRIYGNTNFQGHIERRAYYGKVINSLMHYYYRKKIFLFSGYMDKEDKQEPNGKRRTYSLCAFSYEKNQITPYLYSIPAQRFIPVSMEQLVEFKKAGLVFGTKDNVKGVGILRKAMNQYEKMKQTQERQEK